MDIKFRVWCKNNNEWEKDSVALLKDGTLLDLNKRIPLRKDTHVVQFHTGLKDMAEKEIYDGDIIKTYFAGEDQGNVIVKYEDAAYVICNSLEDNYYEGTLIDIYEYEEIEVIGNIYENPELI